MNNVEKGLKKISQTDGDYTVVENAYNDKVEGIVRRINGVSKVGEREKLHMIFWYLVNNCKIELGEKNRQNPILRDAVYYPYKGKEVSVTEKYAPIFVGKGVCKGFSEAFQDIAKRCGIETEMIVGMHLGERTCLDSISRWRNFETY